MTVPARVSIVTIGVRDFPRMKSFYEGLGWKQLYDGTEDYAHFETAGGHVCLCPIESLYADARVDGSEAKPPWGVALALNVASGAEVDAVFTEVVAAGGTPVKEPEDAPWGGRSSYFTDPEGTLWEIAWAPGFTIP